MKYIINDKKKPPRLITHFHIVNVDIFIYYILLGSFLFAFTHSQACLYSHNYCQESLKPMSLGSVSLCVRFPVNELLPYSHQSPSAYTLIDECVKCKILIHQNRELTMICQIILIT